MAISVFGTVDLKQIATPGAPAAGTTSLYAKADGGLYALRPTGSEVAVATGQQQLPTSWHVYGHSYWQWASGATNQAGRPDILLRDALGVGPESWVSHAVPGSMLMNQGRQHGGFARLLNERAPDTSRAAPYVGSGGAALLGWGINDLGNFGRDAAHRTCYGHILRTMISYWRAARMYDVDSATIAYGAGFTKVGLTQDWAISGATRDATTTTSATVTITLPADYAGEPVVLCFTGQSIGFGGTFTFSGTTGVSGTLATGIHPQFTHGVLVKRFTGLTAANAGQTIVATVTTLDGGSGTASFQGWWLEAKAAPPVVVANVARPTAAGYATYGTWSGTEAQKDADVVALNTTIASVVAEFDTMVQVADIDSALNKTASLFFDGLHPNEAGAGLIADACITALRRMTPVTGGTTASITPPSNRPGPVLRPRRSGFWYAPEFRSGGTAYTPVAGDLWALPWIVTHGRERYIQMAMRVSTAGSAGGSVRWGLYYDPSWSGYPQVLLQEPSAGGAVSLPVATGLVTSPASGTGSVNLVLDPGLYWLALLVVTTGTGQAYQTMAGPSFFTMPNMDPVSGLLQNPVGYKLTGQSTASLPSVFPTGAVASDNAPLVALKLF